MDAGYCNERIRTLSVDVDPDEIYSVGFGTYANLQSWNWLDTIEIPEVFIV